MLNQASIAALMAFGLVFAAHAQQAYDPRKGAPVVVNPGQIVKLPWKPNPPHPDVVMCCGGALQLSWSPLEGGVVSSVVAYTDDTCPSTLQNQENVLYIFQAANRGLVKLDMKQNGDYYISSTVGDQCEKNGMQFLLAVRGCPTNNLIYAPTMPINIQCQPTQAQFPAGTMGMMSNVTSNSINSNIGQEEAPGLASQAQNSAGIARKSVGWLVVVAAGMVAAVSTML